MSEKEKGSFSRALSETENGFAFFWHNKGGFIFFFFSPVILFWKDWEMIEANISGKLFKSTLYWSKW